MGKLEKKEKKREEKKRKCRDERGISVATHGWWVHALYIQSTKYYVCSVYSVYSVCSVDSKVAIHSCILCIATIAVTAINNHCYYSAASTMVLGYDCQSTMVERGVLRTE